MLGPLSVLPMGEPSTGLQPEEAMHLDHWTDRPCQYNLCFDLGICRLLSDALRLSDKRTSAGCAS
jgi:hypothetical protein